MKPATCHPDRKHQAKGLCSKCYNAEYRASNQESIRRGRKEASEKHKEYMKQYNRERRGSARAMHLHYRYGLTVEQYDALLEQQDYRCAACRTHEKDAPKGRLHVDHDHACCSGRDSCGQCIRGLLCQSCNQALGHLKDDIERITRLAAYVASTKINYHRRK